MRFAADWAASVVAIGRISPKEGVLVESTRRDFIRLTALGTSGVAIFGLSGCYGPQAPRSEIKSFTVEPKNICPGELVRVKWDTTPGATIRLSPGGPGYSVEETPSEQGELDLEIDEDQKVELIIGGSVQKAEQVRVIDVSQAIPITVLGECRGGQPVWGTTRPTSDWSPNLKVVKVTNVTLGGPRNRRTITVGHAGSEATIPGLEATDAFEGKPFAGDWTFRTEPLAGENWCGTVDAGEPPPPIKVEVTAMCSS